MKDKTKNKNRVLIGAAIVIGLLLSIIPVTMGYQDNNSANDNVSHNSANDNVSNDSVNDNVSNDSVNDNVSNDSVNDNVSNETETPTETPTEVQTETPTETPTEVQTSVPAETPTEVQTSVPADNYRERSKDRDKFPYDKTRGTPATPKESGFSMAPSVSLTSTKTTVEATSPAILTLDMVNPIVNDANLVVQPILKVPSGVNVISSSFALSGANQYTGTFTVRPGESNHVTIQATSDELGSKTIEAQLIYFPENNKKNNHQLQFTMKIDVKEKTTVNPTPIMIDPPVHTPRAPGFNAIIAGIGILFAIYLVRKK